MDIEPLEVLGSEGEVNMEYQEYLGAKSYYPFGMAFSHNAVTTEEGNLYWVSEESGVKNKYTYNGKEFLDDLDINWHYYGFRVYDPVIGRFTSVDPIAEEFAFVSGFNYAENKPINSIDLHGLQSFQSINASFHSGEGAKFQKENPKTAVAIGAVMIGGPIAFGIAVEAGAAATITFVANEVKDEALSYLTNGASDVLDVGKMAVKGLKNLGEGISNLIKKDSKGSRTEPSDLQEKLTMDEAKGGAGEDFMKGRLNDKKYDPETGTHDKMRHNHDHRDGTNLKSTTIEIDKLEKDLDTSIKIIIKVETKEMKVKYIVSDIVIKSRGKLSRNEQKYFDRYKIIPSKLHLTNGKEYVVLGLDYSDEGDLNFMLSDDTEVFFPAFFPSEFFEVTDNRLSKYWINNSFDSYPIEEIDYPVLISFEEAVFYKEYFDCLIDGDSKTIEVYEKIKQLIENEFPDSKLNYATKIDSTWVMCSYCDDVWEEKEKSGIIVCSKNKHRNNNPNWEQKET